MLALLRRITQEVTAAQSLPAALDIIVRRVRRAMRAEVCSIYLVDANTKDYVLMATRGLNADVAGSVSLKADEGLVSLVGRRAEPVNLEDAHIHPSFHYLNGTGEERYRSFLLFIIDKSWECWLCSMKTNVALMKAKKLS